MTRIALSWLAGRSARPRPGTIGRIALAASLLALASCGEGSLQSASISSANAAVDTGYEIAEGDRVKVTVFDEASLSGEYEVGLDGAIAMPLIGDVAAKGVSSEALRNSIAAALKEGGYVLSPRVAVELLQHRPFYILGEVREPGEYAYVSNLTLDQAVAKAGGFTPRADKATIVLQRKEWSAGRKIRLGESPLLIAPGDTITVREAFF